MVASLGTINVEFVYAEAGLAADAKPTFSLTAVPLFGKTVVRELTEAFAVVGSASNRSSAMLSQLENHVPYRLQHVRV
eukprot:COSAG05_NODE_405_length_10177_cov_2.310776_7_plen_78_part_00